MASHASAKEAVMNGERMRMLKSQIHMWHRHLLTLQDFSAEEIQYLLDLSKMLKEKKSEEEETAVLSGTSLSSVVKYL